MNNKGFAITGMIYGIMILFLLIISSFMSVLVGRIMRTDALVDEIYETLKYKEVTIDIASTSFPYVTTKRARYNFTNGVSNCNLFLPNNTVIAKDSGKLYYLIGGSENILDYKEINISNSFLCN